MKPTVDPSIKTPPYRIRPAVAGDIGVVVGLIRELADFERLPGPDDTAAARMLEAFEQGRRFELLVAEDDAGSLIGYALYFTTWSTFLARPSLYLEDLYVQPARRGAGVGAAFMRLLESEARSRGCGRFEWTVLDWNVRAQDFYRSLGAELLPEWRICRIRLDPAAP